MKKKLDQSGITLVELLISIAIFSVMMVSVFAFLNVATRMFTKSNNEVSVQNETQLVMTHLENVITDADCLVVTLDHEIYVLNNTDYSIIQWDDVNKKLYLFRYDNPSTQYKSSTDKNEKFNIAKATTLPTVDDSNMKQYLISEYLDSFTPSEKLEYNYVTIHMVMKKDNVSYAASKNLYMRNTLVAREAGGGSTGGGDTPEESSGADESSESTETTPSVDPDEPSSADSPSSSEPSSSETEPEETTTVDLSGTWAATGYGASDVGSTKTLPNNIKAVRITYTANESWAGGSVVFGNWAESYSIITGKTGTFTETYVSSTGNYNTLLINTWNSIIINSVEYLYE